MGDEEVYGGDWYQAPNLIVEGFVYPYCFRGLRPLCMGDVLFLFFSFSVTCALYWFFVCSAI